MGQLYCNILHYAFCRIVSPLQTNIFIPCAVIWMSESHQKRKKKRKKTEEEKEDEAHARDIAKLQIKAYKHFFNVMLMYSFVYLTYFNHVNLKTNLVDDSTNFKFSILNLPGEGPVTCGKDQ